MQDPTIQLWCEDEVHFQRHSSLIRMWAPKGQQPRVISPSVRHKVGFFGALNLKTGQLVTQEAPTFSALTFGDFIRYLLQSTQGQIYLILDNARWHRSKNTQRVFRGQSAAFGIYLSASLFSRIQSDRKSLADHSPQGNPQPLFPINRRPSVVSGIPIHYLEAA